MNWRTAGPATWSPTPAGRTSGSTKASPATSRTASSRTLYGKDQADMENVIAQDGLKADMKDIARGRPGADPAAAGQSRSGRRPDPGRLHQGRSGSCCSWNSASAARTSTRSCATGSTTTRSQPGQRRQFAASCEKELFSKNPGKTTHAEIHAWLHEPGIPAFAVAAKSTRFDAVDELRGHWLAGHAKPAEHGHLEVDHPGVGALHRRHARNADARNSWPSSTPPTSSPARRTAKSRSAGIR